MADTVTGTPDPVGAVTAIAHQDYIDVDWGWSSTSLLNTISYYQIQISRDAGSNWSTYTSASSNYKYVFDRNNDGYPEISSGTYKLDDWRIRVKAVNIYGATSATYGPSSAGQSLNTSSYLGWLPTVPAVSVQENSRSITVGYSNASTWYNKGNYHLQIAKGYTVVSGAPVLITDTNTLVAYAPGVGLNVKLNYDNYKTGSVDGYLEKNGNAFSTAVPLYGQNETPAVSFDTPYYMRVRACAETPTSENPDGQLLSAVS